MARGENPNDKAGKVARATGVIAPRRRVITKTKSANDVLDAYAVRALQKSMDGIGNENHRLRLQSEARSVVGDRQISVHFTSTSSYTDMKKKIAVAKDLPPGGSKGERWVSADGFFRHEVLHLLVTPRQLSLELFEWLEKEQEQAQADARTPLTELDSLASWEMLGQLQSQARDITRIMSLLRQEPGFDENSDEWKTLCQKQEILIGVWKQIRYPRDLAQIDSERAKLEAKLQKLLAGGAQDGDPKVETLRGKLRVLDMEQEMLERGLDLIAAGDAARLRARVAGKRKHQWNVLEDGRIEEWDRENHPHNYQRISQMNQLFPRIPDEYEQGKSLMYKKPEGYTPVDIDGNELPTMMGPTGEEIVIVAEGTKLPMWTDKPLDPARQMQAAIHSEAIPEFSAHDKALHPKVREMLEELDPLIEQAVTGTGKQALDSATQINERLLEEGLFELPEPLIGKRPPPPQGSNEGEEDKDAPDIPNFDDTWDPARPDDGTDTEDDSTGGAEQDDKQTSPQTRKQNEKEKKGSASEEDLKEALEDAEKAEQDAADKEDKQQQKDMDKGDIEGKNYEVPEDEKIHPHREMVQDVSGGPRQHLSGYGKRLADELRRRQDESRRPTRNLRSGQLDRSRLSRVPLGDEEVFFERGARHGGSHVKKLSCEIVLDVSGSMSSHMRQLHDAAATCNFALDELNVPHGIWAYSSKGWNDCNHYELKAVNRPDNRGLGKLLDGVGGGGTPTLEAVKFCRSRLLRRKEDQRLMLLFTDGAPNGEPEDVAQQVLDMQKDGLTVIGCFFSSRGCPVHTKGKCPSGCQHMPSDEQAMRKIFGEDYVRIEDIAQMPKLLGGAITNLLGLSKGSNKGSVRR